jgi:hypothetical protein
MSQPAAEADDLLGLPGLNAFMTRIAEAVPGGGWLHGGGATIAERTRGSAALNDVFVAARAQAEHLVAEANSALAPGIARFEVRDLPACGSSTGLMELGFAIVRGSALVSWHLAVSGSEAELRVHHLPSGDQFGGAFSGDLDDMESLILAMVQAP